MRAERVVVLTTSFPRYVGDPSGHFVLAEALSLVRRGNQVTILAAGDAPDGLPVPDGPEALTVRWLGGGRLFGAPGALVRLRENPSRVLGLIEVVRTLRAEARRLGPTEHLIGHWLIPFGWPLGLSLARALGKRHGRHPRVTVVAHGSDVALLERLGGWAARRALRKLREGGAALQFVSRELRTRAQRLASADVSRWVAAQDVHPACLELPWTPSSAEARARLGLVPDEWVLLLVSRLSHGKRPRQALSAACLVPNATTVVLGDGPLRPELERDFPEARFLGAVPREQCLNWIAASDVVLSASRQEGAPTALREARLLGASVVASSCGDLTEWAAHDPAIFVVSGFAQAR